MDNILHGLNNAQRDAVLSDAAVLQVLAPPGSGKTKTLTARVAYLIAHRGLKPWNIITCTFTRKAANEMKERIRSFIGADLAKQIKLGTFHAIAAQYLRQYGQYIGLPKDFGIADSSDSKAILKRIIKQNDFTTEPGKALSRISANKCRGIEADHFARTAKTVDQQEFAQIFTLYEAELRASNLLDYDDLLLRCCFLMETHALCVSNVEAVLIDEFQDTNTTQYRLMKLFAQRYNQITIVGDPDQSIYGFRNAEIENLNRMKSDWPDTLTINLEENYRSSGAILHAAQVLIEQDESRPPKKLQATHSAGQRPVLRKLPTAAAEASWLVAEIRRMRSLSGHVLKHDDFAILLRSASLSRAIEAALGKEGIPYRMIGGVKFFDRAEVKLIVDYLRVINQPTNSEVVERIINVPSRRIGDATIKGLREEATAKGACFWGFICDVAQGKRRATTKLPAATEKGLASFVNVILSGRRRLAESVQNPASLLDLINLIIKKCDLKTYLKNKYENEYEARWSNVEELLVQATEASDPERLRALVDEEALPIIEGLEQRASNGEDTLSLFLANIALTASVNDKSEGAEAVPQVTVSTIHSAKGLEWPVVFIPACYDGSIPHSRSEDNDEERRLLYVGMTRAQAMLYLSCPVKDTQRQETVMSTFLIQPGIQARFEEHGPSISLAAATGFATTLRREPPTASTFASAKLTLEREEDNYWPLNGEEPPEERVKWDYGKADNPLPVYGTGYAPAASMNKGFVSGVARYEEILEEQKLKAIDKRAESSKANQALAPKGRKRQVEGQGSVAGFFQSKHAKVSTDHAQTRSTYPSSVRSSTTLTPTPPPALQQRQPQGLYYKPRTAPLRQMSSSTPPKADNAYMFLSSSPQKPEQDENQPIDTAVHSAGDDADDRGFSTFKPASTFHTTSMQAYNSRAPVGNGGKRYGVKPSMNGWANRARK